MLQISPYSSLNFDHNWKRNFQIPVDYVQKFARYDRITIQYSVTDGDQTEARLLDGMTGTETVLVPEIVDSSGDATIYQIVFSGLTEGAYELRFYQMILQWTQIAHSRFCVSLNPEDTVLLSYTHRRNEFDTVFTSTQPFQFRIEGIFLPSESQFLVEANGFRDQRYTYHQLSALPYRREVLTVGGRFGVPNWVGDKINRIFSLSYVTIDGVPFVRGEGSTPESTQLMADYPLFAYKIEVEETDPTLEFIAVSGQVSRLPLATPEAGVPVIIRTYAFSTEILRTTTGQDGRYSVMLRMTKSEYESLVSKGGGQFEIVCGTSGSGYYVYTRRFSPPSYEDAMKYGISEDGSVVRRSDFYLDETTLSVPAAGGAFFFPVAGSGDIQFGVSVSSDEDKIVESAQRAIGNDGVNLVVKENTYYYEREAGLRLSFAYVSLDVIVEQDGRL